MSTWSAGRADQHLDPRAVLAAFDEQIRRNPQPDPPDGSVERDGPVTRTLSAGDGWAGVTWSDLSADSADAAIAAQIRRFGSQSGPWEWKHYSYDQPPDLSDRLVAAGFLPDPAETLLVAEIADLDLAVAPPAGVELVRVTDKYGVQALVAAHEAAFGGDHAAVGRAVLAGLAREPRTVEAVVAMAGTTPVCAGRLELHPGTDFASIWGGGTAPAWRGRGVFRSVVAYRAALAAALGYRYLQVDASANSRPTLGRLGFVELATTTPFIYQCRTSVR